jgi:molybdopterin/thiamine biosynthesis adenylyltransferase
MRTWVDRFPGRLEYELGDFVDRGLQFALDEEQLEEQGRVVLRGTLSHGGQEVRLEIRYPDLFPYLRPQVVAPELELQRHQNPYRKDLCLLEPSTRAWDPDTTAACLVAERVPYLLALLDGEEEELRKAEVPQGEPSSSYFQGPPGSAILVPQAALELAEWTRAGSGRIAFSVMEPPQLELRGLVAEVVEKNRNRKTKTLAKADEPLLRHFGGEQIPFRWARLSRAPSANAPPAVIQAIEESRAGFGSPPWKAVHGGQLAVAAAVFKEEVGQGHYEDAWVFVVRFRHESQGEGAYLVRGQRLSRRDLEDRLPPAVRLGGSTVSLVGLGSVGAGLAFELARAGLAELRGMDSDTVEAGTTVRWLLGQSAAGRLKVGAVARRMAQDYPYTEFKPVIHRLGQSAHTTNARARTELEVLDAFLEGADLLIDATAEIGVQQALAEHATEQGIPQLYVSTTEGARGGLVARVVPGITGCWMCLQLHLDEGTIPVPAREETATVQPRGCSTLTFVGAGFDISPVIAQGARVAASMLTEGPAGDEPEGDRRDVFVYSFAEARPSPPRWSSHRLTPHPKCPACAASDA